jgi:hypothetical protein
MPFSQVSYEDWVKSDGNDPAAIEADFKLVIGSGQAVEFRFRATLP